jgi:hypothetical protein
VNVTLPRDHRVDRLVQKIGILGAGFAWSKESVSPLINSADRRANVEFAA